MYIAAMFTNSPLSRCANAVASLSTLTIAYVDPQPVPAAAGAPG
jgi:hypothetical protein